MAKNKFCFIIYLVTVFNTVNIYGQNDTIIFSVDSTTISKGVIVKNKKIGIWNEYSYKTDKLLKKTHYYSADSAYVEEYDFKSGYLKEKYSLKNCSAEKTVVVGKYFSYFSSGKIFREGFFNNNGKGNGSWKTYFDDGQINELSNYKDGNLEGIWKTYFKNGIVKEIGFYKNNNRYGKWYEYFENGKLKSYGSYTKGYKVISYSNHILDSLKKSNFDVENVSFPIIFFNKKGKWKYYNQFGNVVKIEEWEEGKLKK